MVAICAVEEKDQGLRMEPRGTPKGRGSPQEEAATRDPETGGKPGDNGGREGMSEERGSTASGLQRV